LRTAYALSRCQRSRLGQVQWPGRIDRPRTQSAPPAPGSSGRRDATLSLPRPPVRPTYPRGGWRAQGPRGAARAAPRLASVGVRSGAGMLLDRGGAGGAKHAAEMLGTLRGLAAKVGQMAGYVTGSCPSRSEAYEVSMKALLAAAPKSSAAQIRARRRARARGSRSIACSPPVNDEPLASASIGQVHVAELADGLEVAVKVQHRASRAPWRSDLANAGTPRGPGRGHGRAASRGQEDLRRHPPAIPRGARLPASRPSACCGSRRFTQAIRRCAYRRSSPPTVRGAC